MTNEALVECAIKEERMKFDDILFWWWCVYAIVLYSICSS